MELQLARLILRYLYSTGVGGHSAALVWDPVSDLVGTGVCSFQG